MSYTRIVCWLLLMLVIAVLWCRPPAFLMQANGEGRTESNESKIGVAGRVLRMAAGQERADALQTTLRGASRAAREELYTTLSSSPSSSGRDERIYEVVGELAALDLAFAEKFADLLPPGELCEHAYRVLATEHLVRDPAAAARWVASLSGAERSATVEHLVRDLAVDYPAEAANLAWVTLRGPARDRLLQAVMVRWAGEDGAGAVRWISSMDDPASRKSAGLGVARILVGSDPDLAGELLLQYGARDENENALWREIGAARADAMVAAEFIPPSQMPRRAREQLELGAIANLTGRSPAVAAAWVESWPAGHRQSQAACLVMQTWAVVDRRAARQWAEQFPEGYLRETLLKLTVASGS